MPPHLGLQAEVGHRDAVGVERVRLDDVGAGLQILAVDLLDRLGLRDAQQVVAALQVAAMRRIAAAAELRLAEGEHLDHRAHRAVEHQDPVQQDLLQDIAGNGLICYRHACFRVRG